MSTRADCKGTGKYVGFLEASACLTCGGSGGSLRVEAPADSVTERYYVGQTYVDSFNIHFSVSSIKIIDNEPSFWFEDAFNPSGGWSLKELTVDNPGKFLP